MQARPIAVSNGAEKVGLDAPIGKELLIDRGIVKPGHRTAVEVKCPGRDKEGSAFGRGRSRSGAIHWRIGSCSVFPYGTVLDLQWCGEQGTATAQISNEGDRIWRESAPYYSSY
jgi:hypothetical protein